MKTKFEFLWPWFVWRRHKENGNFFGCGFPTTIEYHNYESEWWFELQILGIGFTVERYPLKDEDD